MTRSCMGLLVLAGSVALGSQASARRPRPPCPDGRYRVTSGTRLRARWTDCARYGGGTMIAERATSS